MTKGKNLSQLVPLCFSKPWEQGSVNREFYREPVGRVCMFCRPGVRCHTVWKEGLALCSGGLPNVEWSLYLLQTF